MDVSSRSTYPLFFGLLLWLIAFADLAIFHLDIFEYLAAAGFFLLMMGIGMRVRGF